MKSTIFFALFLVCAFTISYLPSATAQFVLDTDDDPLQNGGTYYMLPVMRGKSGGIEGNSTGKEICPLTVVQSPNELDKGIGLVFTSPLHALFIAEGYPLSIKFGSFAVITLCAGMPTEWAIVEREGLQAVKLAARDTVDGWFNIERVSREYNDYYKLVFCPQEAEDNKCEDIGIQIDDDGIRRLVLSKNKPLVVQFQKFRSSTA